MSLKKLIKKKLGIVSHGLIGQAPGSHDKKWEQGQQNFFQAEGDRKANQTQLDASMKEYNEIPNTLRAKYLDTARRAGTYGDTSEFKAGLESEVQAGARGARVGMVNRINALRKALGNNEEFSPEGYAETQANATKETVAAAPQAAPSQDTEAPGVDTGSGTNATSSLQSRKIVGYKPTGEPIYG